MPIDERRWELWRLVQKYRDRLSLNDLPSLVEGLEALGRTLDYDDLAFLSQRLNIHFGHNFTPPTYVCRFIAELLASREALSVLDPAAGEGWLSARITSLGRAATVVAVTENPLARWLADKLQLDRLEVVPCEPGGAMSYDAIVSMAPVSRRGFEQRPYPDGEGQVRDAPGLVRLLDFADSLAKGGVIAWIVPPNFAYQHSPLSVRRNLRHFGLHLSAMLQIAPGAFLSARHLTFDLALIGREPHQDLFVAAVPEEVAAQDELIARLRDRREGPQPSQGRLVTEKTYFSLAALEAADRAKRLAERRGLTPIRFSEFVVEINRPRLCADRNIERLPHHPDAVYLPDRLHLDATTQQGLLPERLQYYLQIIVDREKVDPEYLAGLLNTPLGHAIRESASVGIIPRFRGDRLLSATAYLPPRADQTAAIEVLKKVRLLRWELEEIESQVWEQPRQWANLGEKLSRINHEDRFQDWIETLPFPLASILRAYHAVDRDEKEKYERLLHFFEAVAAFVATIHLSALRTDVNQWMEFRKRLDPRLSSLPFSWSRPTFGMWRTVLENAVPLVRSLLNDRNDSDNKQNQALALYETVDSKPVEILVAKPLMRVLQDTNGLRNRWTGHGGAVNSNEARRRHDEILDKLNEFRSLCGTAFLRYQLIQPYQPTILPGPLFRCPVRRVMGSNPQFEQDTIDLLSPPVTGGLYVYNPGHTRALELLRLVQIRESPQPVCYFYNRVDSSGSRFVSYHSGDQPEVIDSNGDFGLLIQDLSSPPS